MHLASIIPFLGVPESFITKVNVDSLVDSLSSAKRHGVRGFVYTSSATCVLDGANDTPAELDETEPYPSVNLERFSALKLFSPLWAPLSLIRS